MTWEIGPTTRQLHTPGGVYLLMHELMRRSRGLLNGMRRRCGGSGLPPLGLRLILPFQLTVIPRFYAVFVVLRGCLRLRSRPAGHQGMRPVQCARSSGRREAGDDRGQE